MSSVFFLAEAQNPAAGVFFRNLKYGDFGEDVKELQKFLNSNILTMVSVLGAGSAGNETLFFGYATLNAVKKFQESYRSEILLPLGLAQGTGFVGASTRAKIESIRNRAVFNIFSAEQLTLGRLPQSQSLSFLGFQSDELHLAYPSSYYGKPGLDITLLGSGFTEENSVHFGNAKQIVAVSENRGTIQIKVPDVPFGKYDVWVANSKGESEKIFFIVTDPNAKNPEIISMFPEEAQGGDTVAIKGKNFSPDGNEIHLGFATVNNLPSSDGQTLTFTLPNFEFSPRQSSGENKAEAGSFVPKIKLPGMVYVLNAGGISNGKEFTLIYNYK